MAKTPPKQPGRTVTVKSTKLRQNAKRPERPKTAIPRQPTVIRQYTCALDDPFCTESYGAKVPDEYAFATEAVTLRHRFIHSPSSADEYLVVTPQPALGTIKLASGAGSQAGISAVTGNAGVLAVSSLSGQELKVNFATPCGHGLGSTYRGYRLVGYGVRVKNITAAASVAGDITVAVLPTSGRAPSNLAPLASSLPHHIASPNGVYGFWKEFADWCQLPTTSFNTANYAYGAPVITSLDGVPTSETFTAAELAQTGGIVIKPKIHSMACAYKFRPTTATADGYGGSSGEYVRTAAAEGGAGAGWAAMSLDHLDTEGHNCVVIKPSTIGGQMYEYEVCYHLEAIPLLTGSINNPSAYTASPVLPRSTLDQIFQQILRSPWVEFVKHEGARAFGNVVQMLPGLMTKAAMAAMA